MKKLKPCPFCGKTVAEDKMIIELGEDYAHPDYFEVVCNAIKGGCGACIGGEYPTKEEAIEAWNRRAYEQID